MAARRICLKLKSYCSLLLKVIPLHALSNSEHKAKSFEWLEGNGPNSPPSPHSLCCSDSSLLLVPERSLCILEPQALCTGCRLFPQVPLAYSLHTSKVSVRMSPSRGGPQPLSLLTSSHSTPCLPHHTAFLCIRPIVDHLSPH